MMAESPVLSQALWERTTSLTAKAANPQLPNQGSGWRVMEGICSQHSLEYETGSTQGSSP